MRIIRHYGIVTLLAFCGLGLVGCSETGQVTDAEQVAVDDYQDMDLNKAFGGLTYTDEQVNFGDDYYADVAVEDQDTETEDPLQDDPEVADYEDEVLNDNGNRPRPVITVVKLTWGQLDGLVEDIVETDEFLDWSGLVRVDRGIAVARRLILFERPRDHVVRPRIDRHTVAWISYTGPHFDGLIIEIIEPPLDPAADEPVAPNIFHLETPQISFELPVAELAGMDETRPVDTLGNAMRLEGFHLSDLELCPKGFLGGIWIHEPVTLEDGTVIEGGFFKGRWTSIWGRLRGVLRGRYGLDEDGQRVFFGKYIGLTGRCRGLIEGTYEAADVNGHGVFSGEWVNRVGTVQGVLGGDYVQIQDRPGGFFSGRWASLCDDDADTVK